jgi:crotonobetainyl-CoA:carnitine CoA-transferase CaiB-like acyl-CoA transferase
VEPIGMPVGSFKTKDGFMSINARRDSQFKSFCTVIGREKWVDDPRFAGPRQRVVNRGYLMSQIRPIIETKTSDEWNKLISEADILNAKVQSHIDLFEDTQVQAVNAIRWVENDTLGRIPMATVAGQPIPETDNCLTHSPHLGQHNDEVLMELGYGTSQIKDLKANGVVGTFSREY